MAKEPALQQCSTCMNYIKEGVEGIAPSDQCLWIGEQVEPDWTGCSKWEKYVDE